MSNHGGYDNDAAAEQFTGSLVSQAWPRAKDRLSDNQNRLAGIGRIISNCKIPYGSSEAEAWLRPPSSCVPAKADQWLSAGVSPGTGVSSPKVSFT
ncbi:hypothetical protein MAE02_33010 [Microvirga aerophila]|uniref:Uncharacterized protein n=1 Tax=Microvirga aerophila TaxID=670291 RepID=A0A512BUL7_9HYPH|nr:hypothetical protein MAE02_33010 [Microvirga aerophila]